MRIAICDDDSKSISVIRAYIEKIQFQVIDDIKIDIAEFTSSMELLNSYTKNQKYDIIFLDVEMPDISGIDAARFIRNQKDYKTQIVFISSYPEYMKDSFSVEAFDYISKPVKYEEFYTLWKRLIKRINRSSLHTITIVNKEYTEFIDILDVSYINVSRSNRGYLEIHPFNTAADTKLIKSTLANILNALGAYHFVRCSKNTLVNIDFIYKIHQYDIILKNNCHIKLGRRFEKAFRNSLSKRTIETFRGK